VRVLSRDDQRDTEIIVISEGFGLEELIQHAHILGTKVYILPTKTPEERKKLNELLILYDIKEVI
jgi:hypothetical protein